MRIEIEKEQKKDSPARTKKNDTQNSHENRKKRSRNCNYSARHRLFATIF